MKYQGLHSYPGARSKRRGWLGGLGRSRILTISLGILGFGLLLLLINLYELRLMQYDHAVMHGSVAEGQAEKLDGKLFPIVWVQGKNQHTGYLKHVYAVFSRLGYTVGEPESDWDVLWAHDYPFLKLKEHLQHLKPHQKINHFPGSGFLTNKVSLVTSNLTYIPKAFKMPGDRDKLQEYASAHPDMMWIQKSNNHRGIQIKTLSELDTATADTFIQEYVGNPLLVDGRRFDIGVYTTLTSVDPLRVYVHEGDWLVRFCQHPYYPFDSSDINKYVITDDYVPPWQLPSLKKYYTTLDFSRRESVLAYLKEIGKDPDLLERRLYAAIEEVYLSKEKALIAAVSKYNNHNHNRRQFFEMVRVDFVVDEDLNVYLLEINMSPNLSSGHFAANRLLYEQVIYNMLGLVGVAHVTSNSFTQGGGDEREMQVYTKDTHVYAVQCASQLCQDNCRSQECKLCSDCLKTQQQLVLQDAYLEHANRRTWRRVFPRWFKSQEEALGWNWEQDKNFTALSPENKMMTMWFRGKCLQDATWCR